MKALITGITGFVGSHMAELLLGKDVEVYGTHRWRSPRDNIKHILNEISLINCELLDAKSVNEAISSIKPDVIFHLAAQSYVAASFNEPGITLQTNINGTLNLLEAVRHSKTDPIIHICSSSEVYGQVKEEEVPIKETNPLRPASPYAVSKVGEDMIGYQYFISYGLKTIRSRMFTHSVSKWTPVILRDENSGLIDIKYISEIRQKQKKGGYLSGKILDDNTQAWDLSRHNLEIWNDGQWTKIKHISCHPIRKNKLLEVSCRKGVVDVTDNHSIINYEGKEVEAGKLRLKDRVKLTSLPNSEITYMPQELAWLYGFFIAEGTVTGGRMKIANKDKVKLEKCKDIFLKYLGAHSSIYSEKNRMYVLRVHKPFDIARRFYSDCYASDNNKRIPKMILNADRKTKLAFLIGYNEGDGNNKNKVKSEFYRFKTKSPILAMGVCLLTECLCMKYRIHTEHRKNKRYFEIRCLTQKQTKNGRWLLKEDNSITKITRLDYSEEVWDFETANHWFHAGIGGNIVHNTGPRRGDVFVVSAFAKQIAEIEKGIKEPVLKVGNLDSVRTFSDVRDAVKAYWLLVNKCKPCEVYNIGGNRTMTIREMLDMLLSYSEAKDKIRVEIDKKLLRPSDVTLQIPCIDKFVEATGWKPEIPFEKTLKDILDYWREKI